MNNQYEYVEKPLTPGIAKNSSKSYLPDRLFKDRK